MSTKNLIHRVRATLGTDPVSTVAIALRFGISTANALYYLNRLVESGEAVQETQIVHHLETNASARRYTFRLAGERMPEDVIPATLPAYRNLWLSENLTDYDRTNHSFAALCMMVRR